MSPAPGTIVNVTTAAPSIGTTAPTGVWFVVGQAAQGPTGVAVPLTSMSDYANYLGARVTYGYLYDALDEYFHDGGLLAYVSRIVGPGAAAAHVTLQDQGGSPQNTLSIQAVGAGSWGNNLSVTVAAGTVANSYTIQVLNSGVTALTTPNLFTPQDAVNWFAAQNSWAALLAVTNAGSTNATPTNNPSTGTFTLTGGSDDTSDVGETQWTNGLTAFNENLGPGQVSAPGHTTTVGYENLVQHAQLNNRYALLDVADSASANTLITQAQAVQADGAIDASYGAIFAPWIIIPGITPSNPGNTSPVLTRTIPPSAAAAALMSRNDQVATANSPAAGPNGQSVYAIGITESYSSSDLSNLNAAGVNIFQNVANVVTLYAYVSLSLNPAWVQLNNARFRMQVTNDFAFIGNSFLFSEIDGRGQLFAAFNGALSGRCQQYWSSGALYGTTAASAYQVNTGPQVNTPTTIAAGQIIAQVFLKMSPYAEFVIINVVKTPVNQNFPASVSVTSTLV